MAVSPGSKSQDTDMDRQYTDMCYLFTSAEVKPAMSEDLILGYVCNFRRRVARVWAQTACRANFKHYPQKANCP